MLEIVFLGTSSGIPTKRRNHAAIWLRSDKDCMLWDCGEGTQRQLMSAKLSFMKINRIYITHWHADHWAGLLAMLLTMNLEKRKNDLHIYGPEAERFVGDILDLGYFGQGFRVIAHDVPYEGSEAASIFKTNEFEILSTPVKHTIPAVGYCFKERDRWNVNLKKAAKFGLKQGPLIGKLKKFGAIELNGKTIKLADVADLRKGIKAVYSGDTKPCKNLDNLARDADVLIHDATFETERADKMHSGAREAAKTAKQAGVEKLILTHFSRRYVDVKPLLEEARKVFKNTMVAEDFMKIVLKRK